MEMDIVPGYFFNNWEPGVPGGIPNAANIFREISPTGKDDLAEINQVIKEAGEAASAKNRQVVLLSEGIFKIANTIILDMPHVILRGSGTDKTIIQCVNTGIIAGIVIGSRMVHYFTEAIDVTESLKIGDKKVSVHDASEFKAGDILMIDRLADDNGNNYGNAGGTEWRRSGRYYIRYEKSGAYGPASKEGYRPISQFIEIESVSGNTLNLKNTINIHFNLEQKPQVWNTNASTYQYMGVENLKIESVTSDKFGDGDNWEFNEAVIKIQPITSFCWVKNVETDGSTKRRGLGFKGKHIEMHGYRNTVSGCYVHDSSDNRPGGNGYGIQIHGTDGLIENNIADKLCKPLVGYATGGGNVIAYNYVPNTETGLWNGETPAPISWLETAIDISHSSYSHSDLYEGNYAANITTDSTSGNNGWMIIFRNHAWGMNLDQSIPQTPKDSLRAFEVQGWNNEHASIGNVWLVPESCDLVWGAALWSTPQEPNSDKMAAYSIGNFGWNRLNGGGGGFNSWDDGWALSKLYVHYDFNYVTRQIIKDPANTKELPPSLYLKEAPDFFKGYTWPPVNPDGETDEQRIGKLPAKDRYDSYKKRGSP